MRATEFIAEDSYQPPELHTGDKILKGKFKNSPAEIKGFKKDKHNQPVLKTTKGDVQLFKPRVTKLMKEEVIDEYESGTENSKQIFAKLEQLGYEKLGSGQDATVWTKDENHVIKILMPSRTIPSNVTNAEKGFLTFYDFCKKHPNLPNLPRFIDIGGQGHAVFEINGTPYRQIAMERLQPIKGGSFEELMVWLLSDLAMVPFIKWADVVKEMLKPSAFRGAVRTAVSTRMPELIRTQLNKNPKFEEYWHTLFSTMQDLYNTGQAASPKLNWDLHTENVMQRRDGTLVIVDPYYST